MGKFHAKNTFISIDSEDVSTYFNSFSVTDAADEVEVTGFTDTEKQFAAGHRDIKGAGAGNYGDEDGGGIAELLTDLRNSGESVPLVYGPAGDGAGNVKLTYDAVVLSFNPSSAIGGAVTFAVDFRLTNPAVGAFS